MVSNVMKTLGRVLYLLFPLPLLVSSALAADSRTLTVTANIIAMVPCTIDVSGVNPLSLGEIVTDKVNGVNGKTLIPYTVSCSSAANLKMTLITSSAATWYGQGTLVTAGLNYQNLGVQLLKEDGSPVVFNQAMSFHSSSRPKLYAVLVKRAGTNLVAANFYSASATMRVEYP